MAKIYIGSISFNKGILKYIIGNDLEKANIGCRIQCGLMVIIKIEKKKIAILSRYGKIGLISLECL